MPLGAAELVLLAGAVAVLFWLLGPLRRRLERWFARLLRRSRRGGGRGRVVVLGRRGDGSFQREDRNDR